MLEFENVTFKYIEDNEIMINNLSFKVNEGEFISIIGPSGCGKSTIFKLISGLEKMQQGNILINGKSIDNINNYSAFMPQKDLLFPWRNIGENLAIPLEINKVKKSEREKIIDDMLKQIGLESYKNKFPKDLSGGMRQRVSFARTLLTGGDILLLDEPFSALDSLTRMSMQEWLLDMWKNLNKTILFITHDVEEAILLSKSIFIVCDRPITYLKKIDIPLDYPRNRSILSKPEIISIKEELIEQLKCINY